MASGMPLPSGCMARLAPACRLPYGKNGGLIHRNAPANIARALRVRAGLCYMPHGKPPKGVGYRLYCTRSANNRFTSSKSDGLRTGTISQREPLKGFAPA